MRNFYTLLFAQFTLLFLMVGGIQAQENEQITVMTGPENSSFTLMMEDINLLASPVVFVNDTITPFRRVVIDSVVEIDSPTKFIYEEILPEIDFDTIPFVNTVFSSGDYKNYRMLITDSYRPADVYFVQYDLMLYEELRSMKNNLDVTKNVRVLMPFGKAELHLITRKNSGINGIEDLEKKKVGVDSEGTGITLKIIKERTGINWKERHIGVNNSLSELLKGNIDAFFYVSMAPYYRFNNASPLLKHEIKMVSVFSDSLTGVYEEVSIPGGTYRWQEDDVDTYGVRILLVTNIAQETTQDRQNIRKFLETIRDNRVLLQSGDADFYPKWKEVKTNYSLKRPYYYYDGIDWKVHTVARDMFR